MLGPGMQQPIGQQRIMRRTPHAMGACSVRCQMIEWSAMANTKKEQVVFDHEKLDVYQCGAGVGPSGGAIAQGDAGFRSGQGPPLEGI